MRLSHVVVTKKGTDSLDPYQHALQTAPIHRQFSFCKYRRRSMDGTVVHDSVKLGDSQTKKHSLQNTTVVHMIGE